MRPGSDTGKELADIEVTLEELRADRKAASIEVIAGQLSTAEMYASLEERREALEALPSTADSWELVGTGVTYRQRWEAAEDVAAQRKLLTESGVRVEAMKSGRGVRFGRCERPEGYSVAVVAVRDGTQLLLPADLSS